MKSKARRLNELREIEVAQIRQAAPFLSAWEAQHFFVNSWGLTPRSKTDASLRAKLKKNGWRWKRTYYAPPSEA